MIDPKRIEELWEYEKKLIDILHDLDQKHTIQEGQKKTFSVDGFLEKNNERKTKVLPSFISEQFAPTAAPYGNFAQQPREKFQGGSLLERIKHLESLSNADSGGQKKILTFEENSVELDELIDLVKGGTGQFPKIQTHVHTNPCLDIGGVEQQAHDLSHKILSLRKDLGCQWLCDSITVYELNMKMGGDGNFINAEGQTESLPKTALGQNCPHRQSGGVLRCVVCPANYSENKERFDNWLDYIKNKQDLNKKRE